MGECEVCGEREGDYYVLIEGAKLWACGDCARRGKIIARPAPQPKRFGKPTPSQGKPAVSTEVEFVPDYAERIRNARLKMKVGIDVVAERVFEKQSFLERVEAGKALPTEALARRLEKELGVALFEPVTYSGQAAEKKRPGELTLGDLVFVKKKKQGEE